MPPSPDAPDAPVAAPDGPPEPPGAPPAAVASPELAPRAGGLFWRLILAVVVVDQIAKAVVRGTMELFESVTVIPGIADFTYVRNTGVAFGLLNSYQSEFKGLITGTLALAALGGIVYYARHVPAHERLARMGLSLILAGAIGNLIDRFVLGYVVDFVDLYWGTWHFWAFNVADASISIGAVLVFADLLLVNRHAPRPV